MPHVGSATTPDFNPRSPCGERRGHLRAAEVIKPLFQSALPLRGATMFAGGSVPSRCNISIRAPLAGSDECGKPDADMPDEISIRAPLAGSDRILKDNASAISISIRAPLAGSDSAVLCTAYQPMRFQSALPLRGATIRTRRRFLTTSLFQSALPLRGATRSDRWAAKGLCDFNPRSPCGERPLHFVASHYYRQNIVFSKTIAAKSVGKSRKTAAKHAVAWCEPLS